MFIQVDIEKEKLIDYINNNEYTTKKVNWAEVLDFVEMEDKDMLNDPNIFKKSNLR